MLDTILGTIERDMNTNCVSSIQKAFKRRFVEGQRTQELKDILSKWDNLKSKYTEEELFPSRKQYWINKEIKQNNPRKWQNVADELLKYAQPSGAFICDCKYTHSNKGSAAVRDHINIHCPTRNPPIPLNVKNKAFLVKTKSTSNINTLSLIDRKIRYVKDNVEKQFTSKI